MNSKKENLQIFMVFLVSVGMIGILSGIVLVSFNKLFDGRAKEGGKKVYDFRFVQYSPDTNDTSFGFVSLPHFLGEEEFISYRDLQGNYNLISGDNTEDFVCQGSCFCDENENRKAAGGVMVARSLIFLVASISSLLAYERATNHFEEECRLELQDECSNECIRSEVDSCSQGLDIVRRRPKRRPRHDTRLYEDWEMTGRFNCHGRCFHEKYQITENLDESTDCMKLEITAYVDFYMYLKKGDVPEVTHEFHPDYDPVRIQFQQETLDSFCRKGSIVKYSLKEEQEEEERMTLFSSEKSVCCAVPNESPFEINPSIKCNQQHLAFRPVTNSDHYKSFHGEE